MVLQLLDRGGRAFAEAHGFDRDALVFALLAGENEPCCQCVADQLEELLQKVKSDLASSTCPTHVPPKAEGTAVQVI